jgi:hypothetical protein
MKRLALSLGALTLMAGIVLIGFTIKANDTANRLRTKAAAAQASVRSWVEHGQDPSSVLTLLQQVKPALDSGDPPKAEALLDRALKLLGQTPKAANQSALPVYTSNELDSDLYIRPGPVLIQGYQGSAMEPFISPDGRYLFFNNQNDPAVNTNLHFAERISKLSFRYLGELPGANSAVLDAAASIDQSGHFYFTTVRDYDRTMNSLYSGDFNGKAVTNLHPVPGDISPTTPATINMDVSISPDGQTLYISRAVIFPGAPAPKMSELLIARLSAGIFKIDPNSSSIMQNINTTALQYAPAISANGLELFFTRASQNTNGASLRIMLATRNSLHEPFSEPRVLKALTGFVEAPSVSLDEKELFYHKKVEQRYVIYRAERNPKPH